MVIIDGRLRNLIIERFQDGATQRQVSRNLKYAKAVSKRSGLSSTTLVLF